LGQVFNFKLGLFVLHAIAQHMQARPSLELKTQPRVHPVSLSLSMACTTKTFKDLYILVVYQPMSGCLNIVDKPGSSFQL